jgi:predicted amino acid-binding ACT domain protein
MPRRYVITLTAANRVGILAAVTEALSQLGGNLVEIRQTVVQKFFTIILAADFPDERLPHVVADHIRDIGRPFGIALYVACFVLAAALPIALWMSTGAHAWSMLSALVLPIGLSNAGILRQNYAYEVVGPVLGKTSGALLLYSGLFAAGLLAL